MAKLRQRNRKPEQASAAVVSNERKPARVSVLWDSLCRYLSHRYVIMLAFVLLLIAVFFEYAGPLQDQDLWWHMELGKYLVQNFTLKPDHSIYSWTVADPNWVYNGWIPQMFFYLVHYAGGIPLLFASYYGILILIIALFYFFNHQLNQPLNMFYLLSILLVMVCLRLNSTLRPEMFSVLFLTLTVFIYFYSIYTGKNYFWLYPVLMLVWVNSHGVFAFGMVFMSAAFAGELINYSIKRQAVSKQLLKQFFTAVVLSCIALILTPYGPKWVWSIVTSFSNPKFMHQAMELIAYKPIFAFAHPAKYILVAMSVFFFILSMYMFIVARYYNIAILLVNGVFTYFSFMYGRSAYYYLPVWYFSVVYLISHAPRITHYSFRLSPVFLAAFILFSGWRVHHVVYVPLDYNYVGFGVGEYMPEKAADFMLHHKLEGPLFNTYEIGGYLLWRLYPEYRVFIDPRHGPYTKHLSDEYRIFETGGSFEQFTAKYPFKTAIVKLSWIHLVTNFFQSPDWRLVYFDTSAAIFVHKTVHLPENMPGDLGPDRFKHVRSYEALVYIMYAYLNMDDFKNAWQVVELMKKKYYYGDYRDKIELTIENIRRFEKQGNAKKHS